MSYRLKVGWFSAAVRNSLEVGNGRSFLTADIRLYGGIRLTNTPTASVYLLQLARDLGAGNILSIVRMIRSANFTASKIALFEAGEGRVLPCGPEQP